MLLCWLCLIVAAILRVQMSTEADDETYTNSFGEYMSTFDGFRSESLQCFEEDVDDLGYVLDDTFLDEPRNLLLKVLILCTYLEYMQTLNANTLDSVEIDDFHNDSDNGLLLNLETKVQRFNEIKTSLDNVIRSLSKSYTILEPYKASLVFKIVNNSISVRESKYSHFINTL